MLLGLIAIFLPVASFTALVLFLGAYMLMDGIFSVIAALGERRTYKNWRWLLLTGVAGIFIGILTFVNPFATGTALVYLVALWALIIGVGEIVIALRLRKMLRGEGWYIAAGVFTILFSFLVFLFPVAGALTLALMFGIYTVAIGIMLFALALRLRKRYRRDQRHVYIA